MTYVTSADCLIEKSHCQFLCSSSKSWYSRRFTPRRGSHDGTDYEVLTLFCSLQRLKVSLMASMANWSRIWWSKEYGVERKLFPARRLSLLRKKSRRGCCWLFSDLRHRSRKTEFRHLPLTRLAPAGHARRPQLHIPSTLRPAASIIAPTSAPDLPNWVINQHDIGWSLGCNLRVLHHGI